MKTGTLVFDGVEYPDGAASDPIALGWMQGAPPPLAKRIRFEDDRALDFPQIRWSLSHMRELVPTAAIWRGSGAASELGTAPAGATAIDSLSFVGSHGRTVSWPQSLQDTY